MTKFGIKQFKNETPEWAKLTFKIVILLTTVATFIIAGYSTKNICNETKLNVITILKGFDMFVLGLSKLFGIEKDEITEIVPNQEK